jgi:hypothetical protein
MFVSRSEVICRVSIQRESFVRGAYAMSSSFAGREPGLALLLTNRSYCTTIFKLGSAGSHRVAGARLDSSGSFRGPVRRSYTDARVRRHVAAAIARSVSASGNWTSFSASAKVFTDTSGPKAGPAPNAGGAPGGRVERFCARRRETAAVLKTPSDVRVRNSRRDLDIVSTFCVGADASSAPRAQLA